jgi:hypothetical protein
MHDLIDAQESHRLHPDTFEVPPHSMLVLLCVGQYVKIAIAGERFWVKLTKVTDATLSGWIDNTLVRSDRHGLKRGDVVEFERRHIHAVI